MGEFAKRLTRASLAAALLAGGCGGEQPRPAMAESDGPVLVVARVKDAVHLDPAQANDGVSLNVSTEIMKGLVQFRLGTFDVEPAIARSWQMSPDGRTWTFELKKGLAFSDGTPVDAQAVKFNFDRWRLISNPYHGSFSYQYYDSMFGGFPGLIRDVRVRSNSTVVFTLARPFSPFLHDLALPNFAIGSPRAIRDDLEGFDAHPVGWGPYTLVEWVKGKQIVLRSNPSYPIVPEYRTVVVLDMPGGTRTVDQIQAGRIDIAVNPGSSEVSALLRTPGVTVYYEPGNNNAYLAMNTERTPFEKLAVRQAIASAVDVRAIVRQFYPAGALVADNWTPPGMIGENPAVKAYAVDLGRARALLAQAGFPNGFKTTLFYSDTPRPYLPQPQRVAETIRSELHKIGITVELVPLEWSVFLDKTKHGEHALCLAGWSGDNGDPDNFLYTLLDRDSARKPNALNYAFWRDPRFHQLMLEGQASSDPARRAQIYQEANAMVHEMVPAIPIVHVPSPVAVRTSIAGFIPGPDTRIAYEYLRPVSYDVGI